MYLKRATPQNIVIGGIAGAAPPRARLGRGHRRPACTPYALLLCLIIFVWTPPHFWALAIFRREDYSRAQVPMLPVTHGVQYTRWQCCSTRAAGAGDRAAVSDRHERRLFYLGGALVLGVGFLYYAMALLDPPDEFFAMRVFNYSIVYLMALFAFLLVDHCLMPQAFQPGSIRFDKIG